MKIKVPVEMPDDEKMKAYVDILVEAYASGCSYQDVMMAMEGRLKNPGVKSEFSDIFDNFFGDGPTATIAETSDSVVATPIMLYERALQMALEQERGYMLDGVFVPYSVENEPELSWYAEVVENVRTKVRDWLMRN